MFFMLLGILAGSKCQKSTHFEIEITGDAYGIDFPVSVDLDEISNAAKLNLVEIRKGTAVPVPFQISDDNTLQWMVEPGEGAGNKLVYELRKKKPAEMKQMEATDEDGMLTLHFGDQNLLRYYHKTLYPPEGVDTAYKRSAFIHPLWSPNGQVLTRIQPRDHYHHYGIWNPWTHLRFEGVIYDLWNLRDRQGTVRFAGFKSIDQGPLFSGFEALHDHVIFKKDGTEQIVLKEIQGVRVYRPQEDQDFFIVDFNIEYECATSQPVTIAKYRYQGLGWRTTEAWNNQNSEVLTSEGKTREDANTSRATWCIVQGSIDDDYAGVVMMSYPENHSHPERLRIWPVDQNGRGDMFANFNPAQAEDWTMEPGQKYVLKYRLLVYNGKLSAEKAEAAWELYAKPPEVKIIKGK